MRLLLASTVGIQDESPHADSRVEWWFVQGHWQAAGRARHHFMVSLFRQSAGTIHARNGDGAWLLTSVLPAGASRAECDSVVDRPSIALFARAARHLQGTNAGGTLLDAYVSEVLASGPPVPIRCASDSPEFVGKPFAARWDGFALSEAAGRLGLDFVIPGRSTACHVDLRPRLPRMQLLGVRIGSHAGGLEYVTYPSLALSGSVGGEPVRGEAWFDHQWGGTGWLVSGDERPRIRGWTWFGFSLDRGQRLMVVLHHDARTGRIESRYGVYVARGHTPRLLQCITATPIRRWTSSRSGVRYPLEWRLDLPEIDASLRFAPLADDQELPVLGVARTVWEGAGEVCGTVAGRRTSGRGRLELWGRGYLFDPARALDRSCARIGASVATYFPKRLSRARVRRYTGGPPPANEAKAYTAVISRPLWDLMGRRGKRWRPLFGLLLLEALGVPSRPFEQLLSVAGELPHTGSLIVDDIEDGSRVRRGQASIHLRYGTDVAINAANTAYFLPFLLLPEHPFLSESQRLELYRLFTEQYVRSHLGQSMDIYRSRFLTPARLARWTGDTLRPKILETYAHKTGGIVEGTAEAACVIAGADAGTRRACRRFARGFAVAFQIADDVLGFAPRSGLRKSVGEDLAQGKLTYVLLSALKALPPAERRRLGDILCSPTRRCERAGLRDGVALVRLSGALVTCMDEAMRLFEREWTRFATCVPCTDSRVLLRALCVSLLGGRDGRSAAP